MARNASLPFDAFLDILRARGYGIGLHEYAAVAQLLAHWDRIHPSELGDAFAALIGRSEDEVTGIRRLFDEVYAPPPPAPLPPPGIAESFAWLRRYAWSLAAVGALVMLVLAATGVFPRPVPIRPPAPLVPPVPTPTAVDAVTVPPPPAPSLPPPPSRVERRPAAEVLGGVFLVALAVFWSMKVRDDRRTWAREAWSAVRARLPGPYHFNEIVRGRSARLPKSDIEDAATLLGRVFSTNTQARELDVPRTLRATLRRGLMPMLVRKPRRVAETILVLQDVSQEMRLWDTKVEGFLRDLRRQGISLHRMYFDGDLSRLSDRPHRPASAIETVLRNKADAPLLVVSSGAGLAAAFDPTADQTWMRQLGNRMRKTWLTPVSDVRLWPPEFTRLPLDVWPMTELGLTSAAKALAGLDSDAGDEIRARVTREGRVTLDDIERLKRLASLAPHPSPALLDLLRLRFAPDIPDAAILHLMTQADGPAAPIIRLKDDDLRRALNALRRETPDLEALGRQAILDVLLDSEPVAGSAAHERWQIALGVQRLLLADLQGTSGQARATEALQALGQHAQGALGREVQEALQIVPATTATLNEEVKRLSVKAAGDTAPPADVARLAGAKRAPWSWPGLREIVPASLAAGLLLMGAVGLNALPARAVEHVQEAYNLDYMPMPSVSTPQLNIMRRWRDAELPSRVDLYRGDQLFESGIDLADAAPTVVQLASADTGGYFQVRATLPQQNLAVSRAVWVTSDALAFVVIDAAPWANVTITGGASTTAAQQTPFTAALLPGSYQVRFENPNLPASTLDRSLTVPTAGNSLFVTMPGFDPNQAVDSLLQGVTPPAAAR